MSARDITRDLAVIKVLSERLRDAKALLEAQARDSMEPSDRNAVKLDGELVGTVTLVNGRTTARVTNEPALLAWVRATYPTEVYTVEAVRPSFVAKLLDAARSAGSPAEVISGEVVPGIDVTQGDPYPMVRLTADADAVVSVAWQAGRLPLPATFLPALNSGSGDDDG